MTPRFRAREGVVERAVGATSFLASDESDALFRLNETGSALWRLLRRPTTRREAVEAFVAAFPDAPRGEVRSGVEGVFEALLEEGLIEPVKDPAHKRRRS